MDRRAQSNNGNLPLALPCRDRSILEPRTLLGMVTGRADRARAAAKRVESLRYKKLWACVDTADPSKPIGSTPFGLLAREASKF